MYKYLSILLALGLVVLGSFFAYEKYSRNKERQATSIQFALLEGMVQETNTAFSARGVEMDNLRVQNKELQNKIKGRDEEIAALGRVALEWRDKYYKIADAQGHVVGPGGGVVKIPADCKECLKDLRFRVDFKKEQDNLEVSGFTLYGLELSYAEVKLHWTKPLTLDIILAKDKAGTFRIYVDPNDPGVVPTDLKLSIDPSVFARSWHEKIMIGTDVGVGDGVLASLRVGYECFGSFILGPFMTIEFDGQFRKFYGASVGWFPFRR